MTNTWFQIRSERLATPGAQDGYAQAERSFQLGAEIRRLRLQCGLTQAELARRARISARTLARLEAGGLDPRLTNLDCLSRALGVEMTIRFEPVPAG